jgi:tRNA (cytidine56-2'-O)-methyltransferase
VGTISVLRLGHRPFRDQRVTTHVALAARAFGADGMFLAAEDAGVVRSIEDVVRRWGGSFFIKDQIRWRRCVQDWKSAGGTVVHLTMYGMPLHQAIDDIRGREKILVVVGAEKVPGELYGLADFNISVTSQPHSEISSLALFLDRIFDGEEFSLEFPGADVVIEPDRAGKKRRDP